MLYFSSGSFGFSFDATVCVEAVASEIIQVRQISRFVVEAVEVLIVWSVKPRLKPDFSIPSG